MRLIFCIKKIRICEQKNCTFTTEMKHSSQSTQIIIQVKPKVLMMMNI